MSINRMHQVPNYEAANLQTELPNDLSDLVNNFKNASIRFAENLNTATIRNYNLAYDQVQMRVPNYLRIVLAYQIMVQNIRRL